MSKAHLVVGLGNPGDKYRFSRHNVGFMVLDRLAEDKRWKDKRQALYQRVERGGTKLILIKPQTFMNNSGQAVAAFKRFYRVEPQNITLIYDDVDLPFGTIREKLTGSSAGHKGVQSVIDHIGPDFRRLRIGIHQPVADLADTSDFVLADFSKAELEQLPKIFDEVIQKLTP